MSVGYAKVELVGRVGTKKVVNDGSGIALSIAVDVPKANGTEADWYTCFVNVLPAKFDQSGIGVGTLVKVVGSMTTRKYDDPRFVYKASKDGKTPSASEMEKGHVIRESVVIRVHELQKVRDNTPRETIIGREELVLDAPPSGSFAPGYEVPSFS